MCKYEAVKQGGKLQLEILYGCKYEAVKLGVKARWQVVNCPTR